MGSYDGLFSNGNSVSRISLMMTAVLVTSVRISEEHSNWKTRIRNDPVLLVNFI